MDEVNTTMNHDALLEQLNTEMIIENIPTMIFVCIVISFGIAGHIMTILFYRTKKRTNSTLLITVLAIIDLSTCVVLFNQIIGIRYMFTFTSHTACKILVFLSYSFLSSSVLIMFLICIERHRKLCRPFEWQLSLRSCKWTIACLIVSSNIWSARHIPILTVVPLNLTSADGVSVIGYFCQITRDENLYVIKTLSTTSDTVFIFLIIALFVILYSHIGRTILKSRRTLKCFGIQTGKIQMNNVTGIDNRIKETPLENGTNDNVIEMAIGTCIHDSRIETLGNHESDLKNANGNGSHNSVNKMPPCTGINDSVVEMPDRKDIHDSVIETHDLNVFTDNVKESPSWNVNHDSVKESPRGNVNNDSVRESPNGNVNNDSVRISPRGNVNNDIARESLRGNVNNDSVRESPSGNVNNDSVRESPSGNVNNDSVRESPSGNVNNDSVRESPSGNVNNDSVRESPSGNVNYDSVKESLETSIDNGINDIVLETHGESDINDIVLETHSASNINENGLETPNQIVLQSECQTIDEVICVTKDLNKRAINQINESKVYDELNRCSNDLTNEAKTEEGERKMEDGLNCDIKDLQEKKNHQAKERKGDDAMNSGSNNPNNKVMLAKRMSHIHKTERTMTLISLMITLGYIISFIPYFIVILYVHNAGIEFYQLGPGMQIVLRSFVLNCALNPYIIGYFNSEFRTYVKELLCKSGHCT